METKYGIISDIHRDPRIIIPTINVLKKVGADKLILNGDIGEAQETLKQSQDYVAVILDAVGKSGLETFIQPGSHETVQSYKPVLDFFMDKYYNLIDTIENSKTTAKGHDLVFIPGSDWVSGGEFRIGKELDSGIYIKTEKGAVEFTDEKYETLAKQGNAKGIFYYKNMNDIKDDIDDPKKTVVVCHVPRKFNGLETCVDMAEFGEAMDNFGLNNKPVEKGSVFPIYIAQKMKDAGAPIVLKKENRGNEDLKNLYEELGITKAITGHFHESGHRANDSYGNQVKQGEFVNDLFWNSGWLDVGQTGILIVNDEAKISYQNINLKDYIK